MNTLDSSLVELLTLHSIMEDEIYFTLFSEHFITEVNWEKYCFSQISNKFIIEMLILYWYWKELWAIETTVYNGTRVINEENTYNEAGCKPFHYFRYMNKM